jgi:hypothetical protein
MEGQIGQSGRTFQTEEWRPGSLSLLMFVLLFLGGGFFGHLASRFLFGGMSGDSRGLLLGTIMAVCWLVALPLCQYLLMRWAGARPKLGWALLHPNVFTFLRAVGHRFSQNIFALICAIPFLVAWGLFPAMTLIVPGTQGSVATLVGLAMGVSLYFLWYSLLAVSKPRGTLVEELEQNGSVRFHEPEAR